MDPWVFQLPTYQVTQLPNYSMAKQKTFTLQEAQTLVPVLQALLKRAMDGKKLIEAVQKELQDLKHRMRFPASF